MTSSTLAHTRPPFYRDTRTIAILLQVLFLIVVLVSGWFLYNNMVTRMAAGNTAAGGALSWSFLSQTAGFGISEGPTFRPEESYSRAYLIGVINTLRVGIVGVILATILGLFAGIARVSNNWLLNKLASIYIEIFRSTPLLVQLLFWYVGVIAALPTVQDAADLAGIGYLTNRGMYLTWIYPSETGRALTWWLLGGVLVGLLVSWLRRRQLERTGVPGSGALAGAAAFVVVVGVGYAVAMFTTAMPATTNYELRRGDRGVLFEDLNGNNAFDLNVDRGLAHVPITLFDADGQVIATGATDGDGAFRFVDLPAAATRIEWRTPAPLAISEPQRQGFNFAGGISLTPEFTALLLALVAYTGAFIAEIVRAGINAVNKGQWEASRALGLSTGDTLRMVVLPQALRVIIPPLTSQYLNLVKNSSLAIAVGYPDLFNISRTIVNQTGAEVQGILLVMATYLSFSLITSLFMNWYNKRVALVER
ncbi:MAG: ABC transporter permease subunit [Caldilineaceae bacterium]|nr:ABC transporter permease subunit [Caldilineaceae bacterium]